MWHEMNAFMENIKRMKMGIFLGAALLKVRIMEGNHLFENCCIMTSQSHVFVSIVF